MSVIARSAQRDEAIPAAQAARATRDCFASLAMTNLKLGRMAMNKHAGSLRNDSRAWVEAPADDNGDAMIAAMAEAGVDLIFFTSGSEIGFYQEAVAKAHAKGRKAPKLITVTHEHASLNAALGYAAVSGKPAITAAHIN